GTRADGDEGTIKLLVIGVEVADPSHAQDDIRARRQESVQRPRSQASRLTSSCQNRKLHTSVASCSCLLRGLPCPWPACVSMRRRIGASDAFADWSRAAILRACIGSTRLSPSAASRNVAG